MHGQISVACLYLFMLALVCKVTTVSAFTNVLSQGPRYGTFDVSIHSSSDVRLLARSSGTDDEEVERLQEETRMKVLTSRRKTVRSALKGAESLKHFRLENGMRNRSKSLIFFLIRN